MHKFTSFPLFLLALFHCWCVFKLVINSIQCFLICQYSLEFHQKVNCWISPDSWARQVSQLSLLLSQWDSNLKNTYSRALVKFPISGGKGPGVNGLEISSNRVNSRRLPKNEGIESVISFGLRCRLSAPGTAGQSSPEFSQWKSCQRDRDFPNL